MGLLDFLFGSDNEADEQLDAASDQMALSDNNKQEKIEQIIRIWNRLLQ